MCHKNSSSATFIDLPLFKSWISNTLFEQRKYKKIISEIFSISSYFLKTEYCSRYFKLKQILKIVLTTKLTVLNYLQLDRL